MTSIQGWVTAASLVFCAQSALAGNALETKAEVINTQLVVEFKASKDMQEPISDASDLVYLWDMDEENYPYYMIGKGPGRRENIWIGVGHAENTGSDYLIISIRNLEGQFGDFFPQDLIRNFKLNGVSDPGRMVDGGFGIYPERYITPSGIEGVDSIAMTSSYYEMGTNHFYLRFNLKNGFYQLKDLPEDRIAVLGDGHVKVKLSKSN